MRCRRCRLALGTPGSGGDQRGGGSVLTIAVVMVLAVVGMVGAWQAGWLSSGARARSVADLVALAAADAQQSGRPACEVAQQAATDNQAELESCEVTTGWGEFVVDVAVAVRLTPQVAGAPTTVRATARAGVVAGP